MKFGFRDALGVVVGGILSVAAVAVAETLDRRYRRAERLFWGLVAKWR